MFESKLLVSCSFSTSQIISTRYVTRVSAGVSLLLLQASDDRAGSGPESLKVKTIPTSIKKSCGSVTVLIWNVGRVTDAAEAVVLSFRLTSEPSLLCCCPLLAPVRCCSSVLYVSWMFYKNSNFSFSGFANASRTSLHMLRLFPALLIDFLLWCHTWQ